MAKRAKSATQGISLFPFLAVLLCAMGTLSLLLIITTRRIRQQQIEHAVHAVESTVELERAVPEVVIAEHVPVAPPLVVDFDDVPLLPAFATDPLPAPPDPNEAWRERLKTLTEQQANLADVKAAQESRVEQLRTAAAVEQELLKKLEEESATLEEQTREFQQSLDELQQQQANTEAGALTLRRKIDETREQLARAESKFAVVPFDGRLGTTRRPIIIECTEHGITFASEGVTLRPDDLNGFTPRYNPVLLATRALSNYWDRKDGRISNGSDEGDPYVLLIVRPQGTIAYYVARSLLGQWNSAFGYELVREDQQFVWPQTDPTATTICRTIVERMLSERDALRASAPEKPTDRVGRFSDEAGNFRLDEVERLRNPQQEFTFNGRRLTRSTSTINPFEAQPETPRPRMGGQRLSDPGEAFAQGGDDFPHPPALSRSGLNTSGAYERQTGEAGGLASEQPNGRGDVPGAIDARNVAEAKPLTADGHPLGHEEGSSSGDAEAPPPSPFPVEARHGRKIPADRFKSDDPPQWGMRPPGGTIGLERDVVVRISATQIAIGDETAFQLTPGMSAEEVRLLFSRHLNHQVRSWGEPPRSFYWLPTIKFVVSPDGTQHYVRLKAIADRWTLRSTLEQATE